LLIEIGGLPMEMEDWSRQSAMPTGNPSISIVNRQSKNPESPIGKRQFTRP
jgi:hypothetical protein